MKEYNFITLTSLLFTIFPFFFLSCGGGGSKSNNNNILTYNTLESTTASPSNNAISIPKDLKLIKKTFIVYVEAENKASSNALVSFHKFNEFEFHPCLLSNNNTNKYYCTIIYNKKEVESNINIVITYNLKLFKTIPLEEIDQDNFPSFTISKYDTSYNENNINEIDITNTNIINNPTQNYYLNISNCFFKEGG